MTAGIFCCEASGTSLMREGAKKDRDVTPRTTVKMDPGLRRDDCKSSYRRDDGGVFLPRGDGKRFGA
jgi:hypothetical protein